MRKKATYLVAVLPETPLLWRQIAAAAALDRIAFEAIPFCGQQEYRMAGTEIIPVIDLRPTWQAPPARPPAQPRSFTSR